MHPILFSIGPVTIRSFGFFLCLAFLACLFVVWKRTREEGLSEEKVLDIFFLGTGTFLIIGRIWYVISNWQVFQTDLGRILLLFRYPGISFLAGLLASGVVVVLLTRLFQLSALLVLDIFFLGLMLATSFWYFGCFLDGCYLGNPWLPFVMGIVFASIFFLFKMLLGKIKKSTDLHELARRPGFVSLWYLIFLALSFLISSYTQNTQVSYFSLVVFLVLLISFTVRYFSFLKGVKWSNFPRVFLTRCQNILSSVKTSWKRKFRN